MFISYISEHHVFFVRYGLEGGGLVIVSSRKEDGGVYRCQAENAAAARLSHRANLSVYGE